jgi:hypothetical protein
MNLKLFGKNALIYAIGTICLRAASFLLIPLSVLSHMKNTVKLEDAEGF